MGIVAWLRAGLRRVEDHQMNPTSKLIEPWRDRIANAAGKADIDPYLLAGIVVQESGGEQYAQRVERGFWSRYLDGAHGDMGSMPTSIDTIHSRDHGYATQGSLWYSVLP